MSALPADIARFTSDGVLITVKNETIKDQDPNASDTGDRELEMFFDNAAHGQILADELFSFVGRVGRPHEAIEIADTLGLGSVIPLFPAAPQGRLRDDTRDLDVNAVVRAYSFDMGGDAYALEFVGLTPRMSPPGTTWDTSDITFDNTQLTWDNAA